MTLRPLFRSRRSTGRHASVRVRHGRIVPILIVVLLALLLIAGAVPRLRQSERRQQESAAAAEVPTVFTETVSRDSSATTLDLPGTVAGLHETGVFARTSGFVRSLRVDLGSPVKRGDTLLVLDMPDITEQARQARATLEQVEATATLARATLARWKSLAEKDVVTKQELDEKQAAANVAEANVRAARANVANLSEVLRFGAILAPFTGIVTARSVEQGALVTAGIPAGGRGLLTITQTDTLRVMVQVPQSAAASIRVGQTAQVMVQELGSTTFPARVALTARAIDPGSRTLLTELHITNADRRLLPGMFAHAMLKVPFSGSGLRVPSIALIIRANGPQVARVEDGAVHLVPIKLGRDFGTMLEVLDGVPAGAVVVVNPSEQLVNGMRVRAVARKRAAAD